MAEKIDQASITTHTGGCHCGRVRFEVDAPRTIRADECDCSICSKSGYLHLLVAATAFRLLQGEDAIQTYTFNTGIAKHYFCRHCGIKSFYIPRSHPDGVSVNARCLDPDQIESVEIAPFDGRNWEQNVSKLSLISD
ncbi:MAG: GFA family protein [Gammaproteobacteria bacterium]|nr:GFA family protein [Gammaproteobacteria bacterium]NNC56321.1 GFA family protein [Woeseiaceae bacterium]